MGQFTIRETSVILPVIETDALRPVSSIEPTDGLITDFDLSGGCPSILPAKDARLYSGRIYSIRSDTVLLTGVNTRSVEFSNCDFRALRWTDGRLSQTHFADCRLVGAKLKDTTLEHTIFADCKMDYAELTRIRAKGPVIFAHCSLRNVEFINCNLAWCLFDRCDFSGASVSGGKYKGCDFRGNDLTEITGVASLKSAVISHAQLLQLGEALAAELCMTFGED